MKTTTLIFLLTAALVGCGRLGINNDAASTDNVAPELISIEVNGVDNDIAENIRMHVSLAKKECTIPRAYFERLMLETREEVNNAVAAYGYYRPKFSVSRAQDKRCPKVEIEFTDLGTRLRFTEIDIMLLGAANSDTDFLSELDKLPIAEGDPLNHAKYEQAKQMLLAVSGERGYFDAAFVESKLAVDLDRNTVTVRLIFDSGDRYQVGRVSIHQSPDLLSEKLIKKYLRVEAGDAYTVSTITNLTNTLQQSGYFRSVDVKPGIGERENAEVPIDIYLQPRPQHNLSFAAGVSTDEGIRGRASYANRRLNRRGHRASVTGKASFIAQSASAEYQLPRTDPRSEWLTFQAGVRRENVDSFDNLETQLSLTETKVRPWGWFETRYIKLLRQDFGIASQQDVSVFLTPGIRWTKTTADDVLFPTKGARYELEVRGALEDLLSDTSFLRATASAHWIRSTPLKSRIHLRASLGATWVDNFFALSPTERFFTGGDTTIRGYEYEELGPEDANGEVIGGTYLGILSLEYEQPLTEKWSAAVFADAGNAFGGEGSSDGIRYSVGVGARWRSPIGWVRVDLAHPVGGSQSVRLHLRIGPDL